ncbi:MAG: hypothetical protein KGI06_04490 [Candidatus Micrarchaeota archaeon]|nr:hypothetical protein [Candidatus Micrarchaeota archaeon]
MRHENRITELKALHRQLLARLERLDPGKLPKNVDVKKLEQAYESLKGYRFVLKRA